MTRPPRLLTVVGDANDVSTWSGIPYFFLQAGKRRGFLDGGVTLHPRSLRLRRIVWNARSLLLRASVGGYQFTPDFLGRLFGRANLSVGVALDFISHFPLLPPRPWGSAWTVTPYIDATLKQNFDDYRVAARMSRHLREDVLARERDAYQSASRVVCMSRWAADAVTGFYDVPPSRCHVILPGANLVEEDISESVDPKFERDDGALRLGFIGKDWERKGLPMLLDIAVQLTRRGVRCEVIAIGPEPKDLPRHPLLRPQGFIDKYRDMKRFSRLVRSFHFGFLLSSVEALGISTLECLRLGVPVVGTRVGGIVDAIPEGLGFLFDRASGLDGIVSTLESHAKDADLYAALRRRVALRATEFSWDRTVAQFASLFADTASGAVHEA